jgi:hypothetical protein
MTRGMAKDGPVSFIWPKKELRLLQKYRVFRKE